MLVIAALALAPVFALAGLVNITGGKCFGCSSGGGGTGPTYTPLFTWSAAGGTLNNTITGWSSVGDVTYSNDVAGPHGGSTVAQVHMDATDHSFGGNMISGLSALNIGNGDDIWISVHHFFPTDYCFSSGNLSEPNWGNTKWYRVEFSNSTRFTAQTGSLGGTGFASGPTCGTQVGWGGFTDEYGGGGFNRIQASPALQVTRGTWLALQVHIVLRSDATGYMESWVGSTYQGRAEINCDEPDCTNAGVTDGQTSYITAPPGGSPISFIVFGDYKNGGEYFTQDFYIDEIIITTQQPNTVDSGGRPFISPSTRVSDFE